ncbi:uncharacterized protein TNIN_87771 [Trichonephila inaurata madagascariensis]|uniref:Uncharacterized protein n=1 Tax=Trichonephila inaurata madagascariensis TaxID=2747483 RepID=A0A8X7CGW1_9ARAC|nr:uncharacterized protein TNIN_87771 [Trichonephila inaurata madagascariensis]
MTEVKSAYPACCPLTRVADMRNDSSQRNHKRRTMSPFVHPNIRDHTLDHPRDVRSSTPRITWVKLKCCKRKISLLSVYTPLEDDRCLKYHGV